MKSKLSATQWVDNLAKEELPAITSIASVLDKFSNDDTSSIPKLSKVILHDQALSSCLLRVANSSQRSPVHKVTTVSRAAIVLGIQAVKNICLTAKILDGMLRSKNLVPEVYNRLMMLMANAFYAGLLARIMVPNYDENTREEVYLAAMLYHIGETSFWSTGTHLTRELIKKVNLPADEFEKYCSSATGVSFRDLSIGLAKTWGLGDLLVKALDKPEMRTREMNIISLANQLTSAITSPPRDRQKFDNLLSEISDVMGVDVPAVKRRIEDTRKQAIELLSSYGAPVLESYIKPLPKAEDFGQATASPLVPAEQSFEQQLIATLGELTYLTKRSANINDFLNCLLPKLPPMMGVSRCNFWVLNADKSRAEARISVDAEGHAINYHRSITLSGSANLFNHTLQENAAQFVEDISHPQWRRMISQDIELLLPKGGIALAPVRVGRKTIGLITIQGSARQMAEKAPLFSQFSLLIEHLNLCLGSISQRHH